MGTIGDTKGYCFLSPDLIEQIGKQIIGAKIYALERISKASSSKALLSFKDILKWKETTS